MLCSSLCRPYVGDLFRIVSWSGINHRVQLSVQCLAVTSLLSVDWEIYMTPVAPPSQWAVTTLRTDSMTTHVTSTNVTEWALLLASFTEDVLSLTVSWCQLMVTRVSTDSDLVMSNSVLTQ